MRKFSANEISEICADYRRLKNKRDLRLVAQLHACTVGEIAELLTEAGYILEPQEPEPQEPALPVEDAPAEAESAKPRRAAPGTREARLRELAAEGLTLRQAAGRLGIAYGSVVTLSRKYGIAFVRDDDYRRRPARSEDELRALLTELASHGLTVTQAASEAGYSVSYVRRIAKEFGVRFAGQRRPEEDAPPHLPDEGPPANPYVHTGDEVEPDAPPEREAPPEAFPRELRAGLRSQMVAPPAPPEAIPRELRAELRSQMVALTGHINGTKGAIVSANLGLAGINAEKAARDIRTLAALMRRAGITEEDKL